MNEDDKVIKAIITVLKKNEHMISLLSQAVAQHAIVFLASVQKCDADGCDNPATVEHVSRNRMFCDRCCAETIYESKIIEASLGNITGSDSQESSWNDLPNAPEIRNIAIHRDLCVELDATIH